MSITALQPQSLWQHFADLNAVPRPSKKEELVRKFMISFGKGLGLETIEDEVGNILIKKPATPGKENSSVVLLQGHVDMVHQKNADTVFDFDQEGIRMRVDGDWVEAEGTTLGADNGIGVAAIMAVLSDNGSIAHPPIEALFTVDEETGMTGAKGLKPGFLSAKYMLNLDTEDDRELTIGCAGGVDVTAEGNYSREAAGASHVGVRISVTGLSGGHSGMQINEGLGNSNKLLTRLLLAAGSGLNVAVFDGGGLRNAIPREAFCVGATSSIDALTAKLEATVVAIKAEHTTTDPELKIEIVAADLPGQVLAKADQDNLLRALQACPNGIFRMSPDVDSLVQTSNNLARVLIQDGKYEVLCLTRSSVDSEKWDQVATISSIFEIIGAQVTTDGDYPGWTPLPQSSLLTTMRKIYEARFGESPHVNACHAGLECGLIGEKVPGMEMISFGPNITGAHSPDERVQISSVQKFWGFYVETLASL